MLPVSDARLRICTEPTVEAASTSAGNQVRTRSSAMTSVREVGAEIDRRSAGHLDAAAADRPGA